jgi:hypothetical protein
MDDARYVISLILQKMAKGQVDDTGVVRLRAEYLKNVMDQKHYAAVIKALVAGGAVSRAPYTQGVKSFGYTLSEQFIRDKHVRVPVRDQRLAHRIHLFHEQTEDDRRKRMKPVHRELERLQRQLQIDGDRAREIIAALPVKSNPYDIQGILVAAIERGDFHLNPGRYGRVANNITSMKREVRGTLHVGGERLEGIDISCCQPALIAKIMIPTYTSHVSSVTISEKGENRKTTQQASIYDSIMAPPEGGDFERYRLLVQTGEFYEYLLGEMTEEGIHISRPQLKKRFLADVIAKKKVNKYGAEYPSDVENVFSRLFPTVYRFIRSFNTDGWQHENLIRKLQREESLLVVETVCADLVRRYPGMFLITLHDCILSTPKNVPRIEQAFHDAFEKTGFPMKLKVADEGRLSSPMSWATNEEALGWLSTAS